MSNFKLIYIEWCDSISNSSWKSLKDAYEWVKEHDWVVRQVGWVLKETPKYLLIAGQFTPETEYQDGLWGHLQKIPKTWIIKRKILKID